MPYKVTVDRLDGLSDECFRDVLKTSAEVFKEENPRVENAMAKHTDYSLFIAGSEAEYLVLLANVGFDVMKQVYYEQKGKHAAPP